VEEADSEEEADSVAVRDEPEPVAETEEEAVVDALELADSELELEAVEDTDAVAAVEDGESEELIVVAERLDDPLREEEAEAVDVAVAVAVVGMVAALGLTESGFCTRPVSPDVAVGDWDAPVELIAVLDAVEESEEEAEDPVDEAVAVTVGAEQASRPVQAVRVMTKPQVTVGILPPLDVGGFILRAVVNPEAPPHAESPVVKSTQEETLLTAWKPLQRVESGMVTAVERPEEQSG